MIFSKICKFLTMLTITMCLGLCTLPAMQEMPIPTFPPQQITIINDIVIECEKPCKELACAGCKGATTICCCFVCGACCIIPATTKLDNKFVITNCDICCYTCGSCLLLPIILCAEKNTFCDPIYSIPFTGCAIACCVNAGAQAIRFCNNPE